MGHYQTGRSPSSSLDRHKHNYRRSNNDYYYNSYNKRRSYSRDRSPIRSHNKRYRGRSLERDSRTDEFGRERRSPSYGRGRSSSISSLEENDIKEIESTNVDRSNVSESKPLDVSTSDTLDFADFSQLFGFDSFSSTKGKDHGKSDAYMSGKIGKRKYRQYMNRMGGFNRPLSPK